MTMATAAFNQQNFRFRTVNPLTAAANAAFDVSDPAVNTNLASFDLSSGNAAFRVRFEIEETAGAGENVTWNLYCSHNAGAYFAVNNLSTVVRTSDNTTYADDTSTTDLISGSARAFLAGYADDSDAVMPNAGNQAWTGNQHTELDVACTVLAADVADGDTLDFQIRKSGGTTITYTVTPRITVTEAVSTSGSGAITESADVTAGAGGVEVSGSGTIAEASDITSGAGGVEVSGSGAVAEVVDTVAGSGTVEDPSITGSGAIGESADVVSGSGTVHISGSGTITESVDVVSGSGTVGGGAITGSGAITESADTLTASGSVEISGAAAVSESADLFSAFGGVVVDASGSIIESADTVVGSGGGAALPVPYTRTLVPHTKTPVPISKGS